MRVANILALLLIVIALLSCSRQDEQHYRFPLKYGNAWTMLYTYSYFSTEYMQMQVITDTIFISVDSTLTSPEGEECLRLKCFYHDYGKNANYLYVVNRAAGLYQLGWKSGANIPIKGSQPATPGDLLFRMPDANRVDGEIWFTEPMLKIPYEWSEGKRWNSEDDINHLSYSYQIMSDTNISTPMGSFKCLRRKTIQRNTVSGNTLEYVNCFNKYGFVKYKYEVTEHIVDGSTGYDFGYYPRTEQFELISCNIN